MDNLQETEYIKSASVLRIFLSGRAGAGKSTLGKILAEKLGFHFFDTGLLFRNIAQSMLTFSDSNMRVDHENIGQFASEIALNTQVKATISDLVNDIVASYPKIVIIGRDIRLIQPKPDLHIFIEASLELRAYRRAYGSTLGEDEIAKLLRIRDASDFKNNPEADIDAILENKLEIKTMEKLAINEIYRLLKRNK